MMPTPRLAHQKDTLKVHKAPTLRESKSPTVGVMVGPVTWTTTAKLAVVLLTVTKPKQP